MIKLHSGYVFGKYVSEGLKPQPLPPNVLYENGIFNSLYIPEGFNIFTNKKYIDQGPPYTPSGMTYYIIQDYDFDDFTFPEGSLIDSSVFNLTIHADRWAQQQLEATTTSIKITQVRPARNVYEYKSEFIGLIIPIKDFISFLNISPYNFRAIYVRYRAVDNNFTFDQPKDMRTITGEVGHVNTLTTIKSEKGLSTTSLPTLIDNNWHDESIWTTVSSSGHNINLDPNNSYFLKFGFVSDINSYRKEKYITYEINKIWSDEWEG